jgi:serine/threonine protein phosphatase PrpC
MKLLSWGLSDVGRKREHNEDSYLIVPECGLFAVADGMGGHAAGDRASSLAVEILEREIRAMDRFNTIPLGPSAESPPARELREAARLASRTIYDLAETNPQLTGMGTTLTALLFNSNRAYLAHVGDSRAYLYRDDRLEQITEDHSWIEEQVKAGFMTAAEAQESSLRHIITRSVGFERDVDVDLIAIPVLLGDCFVICSDGLSNYLGLEDLRRYLNQAYYSEIPQLLVDAANARGGDDNISVLLVYVANMINDQG